MATNDGEIVQTVIDQELGSAIVALPISHAYRYRQSLELRPLMGNVDG